MYYWYAIQSEKTTKNAVEISLKKGGYKPQSKMIKDILVFEFKTNALKIDEDSSILQGYVLLQIKETAVKDIMTIIKRGGVGSFFNLRKDGMPYPIPDEQIRLFKRGVQNKKSSFKIGQKVYIADGILSGFTGKVVKKKKFMLQVRVSLENRDIKRWVAIPHVMRKETV